MQRKKKQKDKAISASRCLCFCVKNCLIPQIHIEYSMLNAEVKVGTDFLLRHWTFNIRHWILLQSPYDLLFCKSRTGV